MFILAIGCQISLVQYNSSILGMTDVMLTDWSCLSGSLVVKKIIMGDTIQEVMLIVSSRRSRHNRAGVYNKCFKLITN